MAQANLTPEQLAAIKAGYPTVDAANQARQGLFSGWGGELPMYGESQTYTQHGGDAGYQTPDNPNRFIYHQLNGSASDVWDPDTGQYLGQSTGASDGRMGMMALTMLAGGAYGAYAAGAGAGAGAGLGVAGAPSAAGATGTAGGLVSLTPAEIAATNTAATAGLAGNVASVTPGAIGTAGTGVAGVGAAAGLSPDMALASEAGAGGTGGQMNAGAAGAAATPGAGSVGSGGSLAGGTGATTTGAAKGSSGWDMLGKAAGSIGGAVASGAAANALAPNPDTSKLDQLLSGFLTEMGKTSARGDDQWNQYLNTWRPVENKLASTALNYDTSERREQAASEAMGGVSSQFDIARTQGLRDAQAAGVDPSTISAMGTASLLEEAKAKAGAANTARSAVEDKGMSLIDNAARFGRNLTGTSLQASGVATGQGNSAANASVQSSTLDANATNSRNAMWGDLIGAGLKAYGSGLFSGAGG